jgi:hypothetical protein
MRAGPPTAVRAFRSELQRERLVGYFTTPDSLASRVSAAVGSLGMRKEFRRQIITPISAAHLSVFTAPTYLSDSHTMPIVDMVAEPKPPVAACISLATEWWSTRLYLLAAVGQALGNLSRIVFLDNETFIGMASAVSVRNALRRIHPQADQFERTVLSCGHGTDVRDTARTWLERDWNKILGAKPGDPAPEQRVKLSVTPQNLRLWLGEAFLETPVAVDEIETTTAIDLLRILDYPNDFVPVIANRVAENRRPGSLPHRAEPKGQRRLDRTPVPQTVLTINLVNKKDLTERLARNALTEMLDRLGVR